MRTLTVQGFGAVQVEDAGDGINTMITLTDQGMTFTVTILTTSLDKALSSPMGLYDTIFGRAKSPQPDES